MKWASPRRARTLSGRLTLTNAVILALGLTLAAAASVLGTYMLLLSEVDDSVRGERDGIAMAKISAAAIESFCRLTDTIDMADNPALTSNVRDPFVILDASGREKDTCPMFAAGRSKVSRDFADALDDPVALADSGRIESVHVDGRRYRVAAVRLEDRSIAVTSTSYTGVFKVVHKLLWVNEAIAAVMLTLLAVASWTAARRRLRPLEHMVETASAISEGDLSRRVPTTSSGAAEVEQLRDALNAMLHQIEIAMRTREHASSRMRRFLADASHELRTPLATVRGYLQLYDKGMLGGRDEEARALKRVGEEAERMSRLVDELLALARLDAHPSRERKPVDLAALARDGAADLQAQQPQRPVKAAADGRVEVIGDEAQLRQVIGNLLANVRTHTPEDAACTVAVRTRANGAGREAELHICDTGPGMREEDAARIFDRFFRADPDRARVAGGSGLGMSIVQAVVEAHDGQVALDTGPGEGLAVSVRLPLRNEPRVPES